VESAEGVQELSPGWRLGGTLGIGSKKARSSEGAKESVERRAIKAPQYSLLQSGPRLTLNTRVPPSLHPGLSSCTAFGVISLRSLRSFAVIFCLRRKMGNFLLINYEYPPVGGGAASATSNLAAALRDHGHRVVVLTSAFQKLRGTVTEDGLEVVRVPVGRKEPHRASLLQMARFVAMASSMARSVARHHSVDRVIAFFSIPSGVVAWWLNHQMRIPYVVSLRGGDVPGTEPGLRLFIGSLHLFEEEF